MTSFSLRQLQAECTAALLADPFFTLPLAGINTSIPVLSEIPADPQFNVQHPLDQIVSCVTILVPSAEASDPNLPGPWFDSIQLIAEVVENPAINLPSLTNNPTVDDIAAAVCGILHQFIPNTTQQPLYVTKITPIKHPNLSVRHVEIVTSAGLLWPIPTLPSVIINSTGSNPATVTLYLATATAGAVLFYTVDGSPPAPRNAASPISGATTNVYTGPFMITPGTTVRVRPFLAGYLSSAEVSAAF